MTNKKSRSDLAVGRMMQDSGEQEWYTPPEIMGVVRLLLGEIELDPASCETANKIVGAKRFFSKSDDGLSQDWKAETLWLNHPFSKGEKACKVAIKRSKELGKVVYNCDKNICSERGYHIDHDLAGNADWIKKLVAEFEAGNFKKGVNITFASTSETWFKPLLNYVQVFIYGRVNFINANGERVKGVTKGAVLTCFGMTKQEVELAVGDLGKVKE